MKPNHQAELDLTGSILEQALTYEANTGYFYMARTRGGATTGSKTGYTRPDGYSQVKIGGRWFLAHRLAWVMMHGKWPDPLSDIDHINRNKSDNRISNLRQATRLQNVKNTGNRSNNKSGYSGVFWLVRKDGRSPRWAAFMNINGKRKQLGVFKTKEEAIAARQEAEIRLHGEFARSQ